MGVALNDLPNQLSNPDFARLGISGNLKQSLKTTTLNTFIMKKRLIPLGIAGGIGVYAAKKLLNTKNEAVIPTPLTKRQKIVNAYKKLNFRLRS